MIEWERKRRNSRNESYSVSPAHAKPNQIKAQDLNTVQLIGPAHSAVSMKTSELN